MRAVCVVGGGTAGIAAAAEAARNGAQVTMIDRAGAPSSPRSTWTELIRNPTRETRASSVPCERVHVEWGTEVLGVDHSGRVSTSRGPFRFEAVVVATGSRLACASFRGQDKAGVLLLTSESRYAELGRRAPSIERPVVYGAGPRALEVASHLSAGGRSVALASSGHCLDKLNPSIREEVRSRAESRGTTFLKGEEVRVVGAARVEAAVIDGQVVRCDAFIAVPETVPTAPATGAKLGPGGGILASRRLESSERGCFVAGGSAELLISEGMSQLLGDNPVVSGRVAGANSSGGSATFRGSGASEHELFGLRFYSSGLSVSEAHTLGVGATESSVAEDGSTCSVVYDDVTGDILGIQVVGDDSLPPSRLDSVCWRQLSMESLMYAPAAESTDISLLIQAAAQESSWRGRAAGKGLGVRPCGG